MSELVCLDRRGHVLEITIDRPPVNAITNEISLALHAALETLQDDNDLRVGIITGTGDRIFSAGWDLKEVAKATDSLEVAADSLETPGGFAGICENWTLKKPLIAAVDGPAVAGGMDLVLMCDLRVAGAGASFGQPQVQAGIPAAYDLVRTVVPEPVARELCLTGRVVDAAEGFRIGLVTRLIEGDGVVAEALAIAATIASSPTAGSAKRQFVAGQPDLFG